jgi:WD40 repeat protein
LTGGWNATAIVWDLSATDPSATGVKLDGQDGDVVATAISPQSSARWLVTASSDKAVRMWSFAEGRPSKQPRLLQGHGHDIDNLRTSGDGHWLVSIDLEGNAIRWDMQSQHPEKSQASLGKFSHRRHVLQLTPDGKWLITGDGQGKLNVYSADGRGSPRTFPCTTDSLESLALDSSGKQLFTGDARGDVFRFELNPAGEAKLQAKLEGHAAPCVAVGVAQDGSFFVTGSQDQTARLWDLTSPDPKLPLNLTLPGKSGSVTAVAISPDNKWLAFATGDGAVLLWDVARCRMILHATGGNLPSVKAPTKTARAVRIGR